MLYSRDSGRGEEGKEREEEERNKQNGERERK